MGRCQRPKRLETFTENYIQIEEGATYNAYLVIDDQITLFDTVEEEFCGECIERIESVLDGRSIDNIIVQHAEPDHSGGFKKIYEKYPNAKVYTTKAGVRHMQAQYIEDTPFNEFKNRRYTVNRKIFIYFCRNEYDSLAR